ncbi:MAG: ABC transporter substrate-binding protein [Nitrospirales bacterium]|nr:ABC transporter substrate-binding protein [Nitrospirales bacterium]
MTYFHQVPLKPLLAFSLLVGAIGILFHPAVAQMSSLPTSTSMTSHNHETLAHARMLFEEQRLDESLTVLENFIEETTNSTLLDEFYFLQADILIQSQHVSEAIIVLEQLIEEFPVSSLVHEARFALSNLLSSLEQYEQAIAVLKTLVNRAPNSEIRQKGLHHLRQVYDKTGNYLEAVYVMVENMELVDEQQREPLRDDIQGLVLQQLGERDLVQVKAKFPASFPGGLACIRLIELYMAASDEVMAEQAIRSFLARFPSHPYSQTARALLQSLIAKIKTHDNVIAVVLPFSGPLKPFGHDSFNGVRLALEEEKHVLGFQDVALVVKDSSAPSSTQFRSQFSHMLDEFQPLAVIGPLLTHEVQLIADLADSARVSTITPSATISDVRQFGRFLFSTALTPSLQVEKIVEYAMDTLGFRRFCTLFPRTASGQAFSQAFQQKVVARGGEMIVMESYKHGSTDLGPQITHLKTRDLGLYGELTPLPLKDGEIREVYTPGFDAVFLPTDPVEVAFITAQLAFYDINVPILGNNGWNQPDLLRWGDETLEGSIFSAGVFLQSPDPQVRDFVHRYHERFDATPSLFAVQAYDAMRLILDTLRLGAASSHDVRAQLFVRHDLPALSGLTSFGHGGVLDRKVFLIQIDKKKFKQIN